MIKNSTKTPPRVKLRTGKVKKDRGFVLLFAITLSSILLAIALGVANIALKEVKFGTSAKDTNNAFFAADTAVEYTLFNDKPIINAYPYTLAPGNIQTWDFIVSGLGTTGQGCARVNVKKDNTSPPDIKTTINSKGYNIDDVSCSGSNTNRIEREIRTSY